MNAPYSGCGWPLPPISADRAALEKERIRARSFVEVAEVIEFNRRLKALRKERAGMFDAMASLKNFEADSAGLDDLVAMTATGNVLRAAYAEHGLTAPEWLNEGLRAVAREVKERRRDFKARDLTLLRAKLEKKKAESQTTAELETKISELEKELDLT
jgi:hypothetical protein